jgi:hypothetical protein
MNNLELCFNQFVDLIDYCNNNDKTLLKQKIDNYTKNYKNLGFDHQGELSLLINKYYYET